MYGLCKVIKHLFGLCYSIIWGSYTDQEKVQRSYQIYDAPYIIIVLRQQLVAQWSGCQPITVLTQAIYQ